MPASHPKSSIPVTSSSLDDDSTTMGNGVPNNPPAGGYISSSSNAANTDNNSHTNGGDGNSIVERYMDQTNHIMDRLFSSCADDPKGSVHRAWGISLIFVVVFFIISIFESTYTIVAAYIYIYLCACVNLDFGDALSIMLFF